MRFLSLFFIFLLSACKLDRSGNDWIDRLSFEISGTTIVSKARQVSLKEVLLDSGLLAGRSVIVEGQVEEWNPLGTYLILNDESARVLVVLTKLGRPEEATFSEPLGRMKILGLVQSGKRGLPFIQATVLREGGSRDRG